MNPFVHQRFHTKKTLFSTHKFISSLASALSKTPQNFPITNSFNPSFFFNNLTKSGKYYTITGAKLAHAHLLKSDVLFTDVFVANSLLDWYCKSAHTDNAIKLFDKIPKPNVISWNIMISGLNYNSLFNDSWRVFCKMHKLGVVPNQFTYGSILSACTALHTVVRGEKVYSNTMKNGFYVNGYVRSGMIDLFAKNGRFNDALRVFYDVYCENVVCWNAIISGAVKNGENWLALDIFSQMCNGLAVPNTYTFSSVLTACATLEELEFGKRVQGWAIKCSAKDVFVGTAIIDLYAKCGEMDEAVKEFSRMPVRNVVSWTAMLSGFVQKDDSVSAVYFFKEMRKTGVEINNYTVTSVVTACGKPEMFEEAIQIHTWTIKTGFYVDSAVRTSLMNTYSKIGAVELSEMVFREMDNIGNVDAWASMIRAFAQSRDPQNAIEFFQRMLCEGLKPDKFCCSSVLSIVDSLILGRQLHCYILKSDLVFDVSISSSLFTMYSKCGSLEESNEVFKQMSYKDNVSWASMITGLAEHGRPDQALHLCREVLFEEARPDEMTCTSILTTCSALRLIQIGKQVHEYALRAGFGTGILVGGALVTMYSKCGDSKLARRVFDMMPEKDPVSCCSLFSGYAHNGHVEEALYLFNEMRWAGLGIDTFTVSAVLGAFVLLDRPGVGFQLHAHVTKIGLDSEASVGSSLLKMYSKCGSTEDCCQVFDRIRKPDLIAWTALIVSYAQHGNGAEALRLYNLMKEEDIKPDSVTFVGILFACSHNGLIEEGYFHFNSMRKDYGIEPSSRHYACMVDLLGRSGRLKEAKKFIQNMLIEPDALVWGTLLAACKVHGDIEVGRLAAKKVLELNPCDGGAYVSFSNICADVGRWEEVNTLRMQMKGTGVEKEPGWSFV